MAKDFSNVDWKSRWEGSYEKWQENVSNRQGDYQQGVADFVNSMPDDIKGDGDVSASDFSGAASNWNSGVQSVSEDDWETDRTNEDWARGIVNQQ